MIRRLIAWLTRSYPQPISPNPLDNRQPTTANPVELENRR